VSLIVRREGSVEVAESGPSNGRAGTAPNLTSFAAAVPKSWVNVGFHEASPHREAGLERFRLEAIATVRGPRPSHWKPGMFVTRREVSSVRPPESSSDSWVGLIEPGLSTSAEQAGQLLRGWEHNPFRVALLIACRHVPRFWDLSPSERDFDHCGLPERAAAQRSPILRKVVRRLQRVASPEPTGAPWDTLAHFEMLPEHVAHLREYLAERRELAALSNLVEREVEIWMVKTLDGEDSPSHSNA
jgi:hypothetical protein